MLSAAYRERVAASAGKLQSDPAQLAALAELERLRAELIAAGGRQRGGWLQRLLKRPVRLQRGVYLWGGVGRGKTFLMDLFFDSLPLEAKRRYHYHRFMQFVHGEMRGLRERERPLDLVADRFAADARLLCLDEFFVTDITDAMLLGGLLKALFERAVTLVTTSNLPPQELYRDGLQRARFLPAIELLQTHTEVIELDGGIDYRLRALRRADLYCCGAAADCDPRLAAIFGEVNAGPGEAGESVQIAGRPILTRRLGHGVAWFDFAAICEGPRSQNDYIELARLFHTVLISGVPVLGRQHEDPARRFLNLVDEFYDRNVKLVLAAAAPIAAIYQGERLRFEYRRTKSRLQEMQSYDYLARQHLP